MTLYASQPPTSADEACTMSSIRPPAVAGSFYPADPTLLRQTLRQHLDAAAAGNGNGTSDEQDTIPKAIIAPHAGYIYSGGVAAAAYRSLAAAADRIRRVVLIGPDHRVGFRGLALSSADAFRTPLGDIPLASDAAETLLDLPQMRVLDAAHSQEHSLEVQLPFLQTLLGDFELIPIVVGEADTDEVAAVLERLWGGDETLIVISSDLSHFHDYATAQAMDAATCQAIEQLRPNALSHEQACGRNPIRGLLALARRKRLGAHTIALLNSGDTAGDKAQVVGYGAWHFYPTDADSQATPAPGQRFDQQQRHLLLAMARQSIAHGLHHQAPLVLDPSHYPAELRSFGASFVTLHQNGQLRGCIGSLEPRRPLLVDILNNAYAAAYQDPRFRPVSGDDIKQLDLSISILSPATAMHFDSEQDLIAQLRPGIDGLILSDGSHRGTFLPSVWSQLPDPQQFLIQLKAKAGLPADHWSDTIEIERYTTESFA